MAFSSTQQLALEKWMHMYVHAVITNAIFAVTSDAVIRHEVIVCILSP